MTLLARRRVRMGVLATVVALFLLFWFSSSTEYKISPPFSLRPEEEIAKQQAKESPKSHEQLALHDALKAAEQAAKDKAALKDLERTAQQTASAKPSEQSERPKEPPSKEIIEFELNDLLSKSPIVIFSKTFCAYSRKAKKVFTDYDITPRPFIVELDEHPYGAELQAMLGQKSQRTTVPNVMVAGISIGGGDDVELLHEQGKLAARILEIAGDKIAIA